MDCEFLDISDANENVPAMAKSIMVDVLGLNNLAIPHVNELTSAMLSDLRTQSCLFLVALEPGTHQVAGFLILMDENAVYSSPNYQYFKSKFRSFVYVDRIVVDQKCRGTGLGKKLYRAVKEKYSGEKEVLCCEVNSRPPNPQSIQFHQQLGFSSIDSQETEQGKKEVQLMTTSLCIADKPE